MVTPIILPQAHPGNSQQAKAGCIGAKTVTYDFERLRELVGYPLVFHQTPELSMAQVAEQVGQHKTSVHRLLDTLIGDW